MQRHWLSCASEGLHWNPAALHVVACAYLYIEGFVHSRYRRHLVCSSVEHITDAIDVQRARSIRVVCHSSA